MTKLNTSRRTFMLGAGGFTFAFALEGPAALAATLGKTRVGKAFSPWVSIAPNGTITIMRPFRNCVTSSASGRSNTLHPASAHPSRNWQARR